MKKILKFFLYFIGFSFIVEFPVLLIFIIPYFMYKHFSKTGNSPYTPYPSSEGFFEKIFNMKKQKDIKNIQDQINPYISFYIKAYTSVWDTWPTKITLIDYDYDSIRDLIEKEKHIDTKMLSNDQFKNMVDEQIFSTGFELFKNSFEKLTPDILNQEQNSYIPNADLIVQNYYALLGHNKSLIPYLTKYINDLNKNGYNFKLTEVDIKNRILNLDKSVAIKNRSEEIKSSVLSNKPLISNINIRHIDSLDGVQFEKVLGKLFEKMGYEVSFTKVTGDQGADLLLSKAGEKKIIQAKRYNHTVSNSAIQEAVAAKAFYRYDMAAVATNNYFTAGAIELAKSNGVELIDRTTLKEWLKIYPIHRNEI